MTHRTFVFEPSRPAERRVQRTVLGRLSGAQSGGDEEPAPGSDPLWDPFELDDQEPEPEYGDFWDDADELED